MNDIELTDARQTDAAQSRPFIIYSGTDVTGTVSGNPSVESYCSLDYTSASRYRLNREDHNQIFQFFLTTAEGTRQAYCLDKFADGPYGDIPYRSEPFENIFLTATERQKNMFGYIVANAYPTVSTAQTFNLLGIDYSAAPVLDDNDAYAVVQIAIWVLLGLIAPGYVFFLYCATG